MRISLSLIKFFIDCDLPLNQLSSTLTLLGIEVDRIINESPPFSNVVVAEILSVAPHLDANKLQIATIFDGKEKTTVVCGAPNCREGIKTAFAKPGAILKGSGGKPLTIAKTSIRGIESNGMLCSEEELAVPSTSEGICEFPREIETGTSVLDILWDPIFELSLTPNLGHCMSALGIARELSAALQLPLKKTKISLRENGTVLDKKLKVSVEDPNLCPRYMCRLIEGVKIAPSPLWLQRQLIACGLKPISNVVDITNLVLFKWGQPLHAFDFDRLETPYLTVAPIDTKENFLGLDGIARELPPGTLTIRDGKGAVAIGGILGGADSAVTEATQNILLEAAYFDPMTIRKTAKNLGLRTESSHRFEKGTDPLGIQEALDEACSLILQICGGRLGEGTIDIKTDTLQPKLIPCRLARVIKILGTPFSLNEIAAIFTRLGFTSLPAPAETLQVEVPLFRSDMSTEIDLIEEIARIYGYNNLEKRIPVYRASQIPHDPEFLFEKEVRQRLVGMGLQEFLTSDLISPKLSSLAQELVSPDITYLQTTHAKTEEYSILRPSLLPGLMQIAKGNLDYKNQTLHGFEIGRIHFLNKGKLTEVPMGALLLTGKTTNNSWSKKIADVDFYDMKGLLENLLEGLSVAHFNFLASNHLSFHPYAQANIYSKEILIGSFGQIHPNLLAKLDIKQPVFFAEINLHHLQTILKKPLKMHPISSFPSSDRDWTVSLPFRAPIETILKTIHTFNSPLLVKTEVLDVYIPEDSNTKNITFRFTYRDRMKTISLEEVETEHARLIGALGNLFSNI